MLTKPEVLLADLQLLDEVSAEANVSRKHHAACITAVKRLREFVVEAHNPKPEATTDGSDGMARSGEGNQAAS